MYFPFTQYNRGGPWSKRVLPLKSSTENSLSSRREDNYLPVGEGASPHNMSQCIFHISISRFINNNITKLFSHIEISYWCFPILWMPKGNHDFFLSLPPQNALYPIIPSTSLAGPPTLSSAPPPPLFKYPPHPFPTHCFEYVIDYPKLHLSLFMSSSLVNFLNPYWEANHNWLFERVFCENATW